VVSTNDIKTDVALLAERAVAMARAAPKTRSRALRIRRCSRTTCPTSICLIRIFRPSRSWRSAPKRAESAGLAVKGVTKSGGASASAGIGGMVLVTSGGLPRRLSQFGPERFDDGDRGAKAPRWSATTTIPRPSMAPISTAGEGGTHGRRAYGRTTQSRKVETKRVPVGSTGRVAGSLVGHLASAINAAAVARKTSFLKDKLGNGCSSRTSHVIDDPRRLRGLRSRPFDAEGVATKRLAVVEDGVMTSWFLDSATRASSARDHWPCPARRVVDPFTGTEQSSSFRRYRYARCMMADIADASTSPTSSAWASTR